MKTFFCVDLSHVEVLHAPEDPSAGAFGTCPREEGTDWLCAHVCDLV